VRNKKESAILTVIISAIISAIVSTTIWIFKDKIIYKREQNNYNLKLLNELYTCVMIISHSSDLDLNQNQKNDIENAVGKLGFNLQLYFPALFNDDYNKFLNEAILLRFEIENKIIHNELNDKYFQEYIPKMKKFKELCKIIFDNIVDEAKKIK